MVVARWTYQCHIMCEQEAGSVIGLLNRWCHVGWLCGRKLSSWIIKWFGDLVLG